MAVTPNILLSGRPPSPDQTFSNVLLNLGRIEDIKAAQARAGVAEAEAPIRQRLLGAQAEAAEAAVPTEQARFNLENRQRVASQAGISRIILDDLVAGNKENVIQRLTQHAQELDAAGIDNTNTLRAAELAQTNPGQLLQASMAVIKEDEIINPRKQVSADAKPAGQIEFESLLEGLPEEDKEKARKIKLGLAPRAVGSAIQTITGAGTAEEVGKTGAIIKQREKFGEMTGASRAKSIDKGFERIVKIDAGLLNIDRAITALKGGAGTGAIQKLLPSIRAASVELDQIRNELALDVIGGVTLGAISEKELDLTKQVALPTGLDEPALIQHLEDRRAAQEKLRGYFSEQIDFLEQGGTIAGFLRSKKRVEGIAAPATAQAQPSAQIQEGATATNPTTGQKVIFTNGQWQPAP